MKRLSRFFTRISSTQRSRPVELDDDNIVKQLAPSETPNELPELPVFYSLHTISDLFDCVDDQDSESTNSVPIDYFTYFTNAQPQSLFSTNQSPSLWTLPLPQDIIFEIIDTYLYHDPPKPDTPTLFALACTARCLTFYCRSLIYRTITINHRTKNDDSMPKHFAELLCLCPEVREYVQTICIDDTGGMFQHSAPYAEDEQCLRYILRLSYSNLRRVELSLPIMWILLPATLQEAFETCFRTPTLCELSILRGRIPAALLQCCVFVEHLEIRAVLSYPDPPKTTTHDTCTPRTLVITDFTDEGETLQNIFHGNSPLSLGSLADLQTHSPAGSIPLLKPVFGQASASLVALTIHATSLSAKRASLGQLTSLKTLTLISDLLSHSTITTEEWLFSLLSTLPRPSNLESLNVITIQNLNFRPIDNVFSHTFNASWPRLHSVSVQVVAGWMEVDVDQESIQLGFPTLAAAGVLRISPANPKDYPDGRRK